MMVYVILSYHPLIVLMLFPFFLSFCYPCSCTDLKQWVVTLSYPPPPPPLPPPSPLFAS